MKHLIEFIRYMRQSSSQERMMIGARSYSQRTGENAPAQATGIDPISRRTIFGSMSALIGRNLKHAERPSAKIEAHWGYRLLGLSLLLAFWLQHRFGIKLYELERLQADDDYKIFSGLLVLTYVLNQWRLPLTRWLNCDNHKIVQFKHRHRAFGSIAPLVFYLHATSTGYAYLAALSNVYLADCLVGYGSGEIVHNRLKKTYLFAWTVVHVGLSTGLLFLSAYHAYVALAYK